MYKTPQDTDETLVSASDTEARSPGLSDDDSGISVESQEHQQPRMMNKLFASKKSSPPSPRGLPVSSSSSSPDSSDDKDSCSIDKSKIPEASVFDSHCHLEFISKRFRREVTLEECCQLDGENLGSKFYGCIVNYCQPHHWSHGPGQDKLSPQLRSALEDKRIGLSLGVHPHFADRMTDERWRQLETLVADPGYYSTLRVTALGECGLDYSWKNTVPKDVQKQVFLRQLRLALKNKLPIVLHIREAEADGLAVLQEAEVPEDYPMHRHCFGGSVKEALDWMKRYPQSKIGVTGLVTYSHAHQVSQVVHSLGLDHLVLETDAPYFTPLMAKKNLENCSFPGQVIHVAARVAEIKKKTLEEVLEANLKNCRQIYSRYFERRQLKKSSSNVVASITDQLKTNIS